jgi:hypothetical protein
MPDDDTARILTHACEAAEQLRKWEISFTNEDFLYPEDQRKLIVELRSGHNALVRSALEIERLRALHADITRLLEEGTELFRKREAEIDRLTAENTVAWDTIEALGDDVTRAFERVKAALRAKSED